MTTPLNGGEPIAKLPFQVRPDRGEGGRSFIARLARANHLPPAYLRKCLTDPPHHRGLPSWDRLAAVTGRDPVQLRQTLETTHCAECGAPMTSWSSFGVKARTCSTNCRMTQRRRMSAHYQRTAPCRVCGKPVDYRVGQRRYLCSSECRRFAFECRRRGQPLPRRAQLHQNEQEPSENVDPLTDICPACGGYLRQPRTRRACSRRCTRRIRRWLRTPMPPPTPCSQCGELAFAFPDGRPRTVCSDKCRLRAHDAEREAEREQAIAAALAEGTRTCRVCGGRYRPASPNQWCSETCLDYYMDQCRDSQACPSCGASTANLPLSASRIRKWCSNKCQRRAIRWRAEFRERARHPPRHLSFQARQILIRNHYRGPREYQPDWSSSRETKDESPPAA